MSQNYITQLNGIRIFLTIMVVLSNMALFKDVDPGFLKDSNWFFLDILASVPVRVDVFFMLTGFLLFYVYGDTFSKNITYKNYIKFLFIRLARIYPVHVFTLFLIGALYFFNVWQSVDMHTTQRVVASGSWFLNLTLLNAWGLGEHRVSWNGPAWSISAEFFNYLFFPVIVLILIQVKRFRVQVMVFAVVMLLYCFLQLTVIKDMGVHNGYGALIRAIIGMVIGINLAQIYISKKLSNLPWDFIALFLIILMGGMMTAGVMYDVKISFMFYVPLPLLIFAIASSKGFIKSFFSFPVFVYLGNLSFAVYMLHQPITRIFFFVFEDYYKSLSYYGGNHLVVLNLCMVFCVILLVAAFINKFVENPAREWMKKRF